MESPWISLLKAREKLSAVLWKAWHYDVINPLFHRNWIMGYKDFSEFFLMQYLQMDF